MPCFLYDDAGTFLPPAPPAVVFDAQFNPLLTFNVRLPFMASAAYPGGVSAALSDFTAIVRRAAQVGWNYIQVTLAA